MTNSKASGIFGLECKLASDFKARFHEAAINDPYCVLAYESRCTAMKAYSEIKKNHMDNFWSFFIDVSIDEKGVSADKYVYIPPKNDPEPSYFAPPSYESQKESGFSYCSLFFSDNKDSYYVTTGSTRTDLKRDVSNPNIFYDASGNKYYSSDNGGSVTKW